VLQSNEAWYRTLLPGILLLMIAVSSVAAERGDDFDAETAEIGPGPYRLIRIRGTGARIE